MPKGPATRRYGTELSLEDWRDLPMGAVSEVSAHRRWKTIRVMCPQCGRRLRVPLVAFTVRPDATLTSDRSLTCADDDISVGIDGCGAVFPVVAKWAGLEGYGGRRSPRRTPVAASRSLCRRAGSPWTTPPACLATLTHERRIDGSFDESYSTGCKAGCGSAG